MKKILFALLVLIAIVVSLIFVKYFLIGEPANMDSLTIHVLENDRQLTIHIKTMDSAMAICNPQYRMKDSALYLTVRAVLCSPLYRSGEKCIYYEITEETEIFMNGKRIWSK